MKQRIILDHLATRPLMLTSKNLRHSGSNSDSALMDIAHRNTQDT